MIKNCIYRFLCNTSCEIMLKFLSSVEFKVTVLKMQLERLESHRSNKRITNLMIANHISGLLVIKDKVLENMCRALGNV